VRSRSGSTGTLHGRGAAAALIAAGLLAASHEDLAAQARKAPAKKAATAQKTAPSASDLALEKALLQQTTKVQGAHAKELATLATWASTNGLKAEAEKVIATIARLDPQHAAIEKLRAKAAAAKAPDDAAKKDELLGQFQKKLETANEKNAQRLFDFAQKCMKVGLFTRAYDLVQAVIEADPDHKKARDILSYAWDPASKTWITKWEMEQRKKSVLTPEGWVKKENKKKFDQGLREYQGKWVTKEEEKRIRTRNNYNPYSIETEHFEVQTNLGREKALEFSNLLEDFHGQFFRFFIGYYDQVAGAKLLFNQAKTKKKHQVYVFPSRDDYLTFIKAEKGNKELYRESAGVYVDGDQKSYFYFGDDQESLYTMYHEVTHQLFAETKEGRGNSAGNNWVPEGIASYMETWQKVAGKWKPGARIDANRLQVAKRLMDGFNLQAYIAIGNQEFHEENRGANYALGAALSHFLMHYQGGIYKEDYVRFISAYYGGKVHERSLGEYIEVEGISTPEARLVELEKQLKEYMAKLGEPAETAETPAADGEDAPTAKGGDS
jgi:hypothetical protein